MPKFKQFDGFQIDVRSRDHNPPHFHVIGPDFEALVRMDTMALMAGRIPRKALAEAVAWASAHRTELTDEWRRLNERD